MGPYAMTLTLIKVFIVSPSGEVRQVYRLDATPAT